MTAAEGTVLCPPVPGLSWSPQGRTRGWGAPISQQVPGCHKQRRRFGSLWKRVKQRNERSRVRSCICSPQLLPLFPGWQQEGDKVNNAQTPRELAVTAAPDISPTCFPRQTLSRDPRWALLSSISCSLTTARNWQQPLWPAAPRGHAAPGVLLPCQAPTSR